MATYRPAEPAPGIDPGAWEATHKFIEQVLIDENYAMATEQHSNLGNLAGQTCVYGRN